MEEKSSELIKRILDVYLFSDMMFFKENKFLKRRLGTRGLSTTCL